MITMLDVRGWADEATDKFVRDGAPLSQTITKIAQRESLTRDGIQRVVEETNHLVRERLATRPAYDANASYKIASTDEVIAGLAPVESTPEKVAGIVLSTAPAVRVPAPLAGLEKVASETESMLKFASNYADAMRRLDTAILKLARIVEWGQFRRERVSQAFASAMDKVAGYAADRLRAGGTVNEMLTYANMAFPDDKAKWVPVFDAVQDLLVKKAHPVPAGWIREDLKPSEHAGKFIVHNGKAALYELLDTIKSSACYFPPIGAAAHMGGALLKFQREMYSSYESANNDVREWVNRVMPDVRRVTGHIEKTADAQLLEDAEKLAGVLTEALKAPAAAGMAAAKKLAPHALWMIPSVIAMAHIARGVGDLATGSEFDPEKERETTRSAPGAAA